MFTNRSGAIIVRVIEKRHHGASSGDDGEAYLYRLSAYIRLVDTVVPL